MSTEPCLLRSGVPLKTERHRPLSETFTLEELLTASLVIQEFKKRVPEHERDRGPMNVWTRLNEMEIEIKRDVSRALGQSLETEGIGIG